MMENTLSIRIVNVDSYVALPLTGYDPTYSQFRGSTVPNVPVIRVFGITPQGVKTCVHVHCVFPYIVIPLKDEPNVDGFMHDLADNLEININKQMNIKGTNNQIFKITQITGIPFYGYHTAQVTFLKIFFYRPSMIKKAVEIMESGILLNRTFQPHESHITFTLQFLMDYNLHGMSFMNVANYTVRSENRVSFCDFEIDVLSQDILNAQNLGDNLDMNPGLAYIWEEEKTRRRLEGDSSQISLSKYENPISPYKSPLELQLKDKLINYLKKKVKNSKRSEATNSANMMDASFVESHSQDIYFGSIEDSQVKSLLEGLNEAWDEYEQAVAVEEDSILGSQAVEKIEDDEIEEMVHLSQPLEDSDDVFSDDDINKPSTSGLNRPLFVDGNSDETSPQKQKKKRKTPPRRYKALDIVKEKSPKKSSSVTPRKDYKKFLFAEQTIKKAASTSKFNSEEFENSKKPSAEASASKFDSEEEFETSKIKSFYFNDSETTISTVVDPPSLSDAEKYIEENNLRRIPEIKPFYSNDEPTSSKEVYKNVVSVQNKNVHDEQTSLGDSQKKIYETIFNREAPSDFLNALTRNKPVILTPIERPPDYESAKIWLKRQKSKKKQQNLPSQDSLLSTILEFNSCSETTLCSSKIQEPLPKSLSNSNSYLTLFCMELHVSTRANLNPDPEYDEIVAVFFNITRDVPDDSDISKMTTGVLTSDSVSLEDGVVLIKVENELEIIGKLIEIIRKENPDILAGYEIENSSWGYFIQRSFAHGINIIPELGRIQNPRPGAEFKAEESMRDIKITGRIVLNIWRMLRHEISVMSYTFESMMYHILNTRVAHYSYQTLTKWWSHYSQKFRNLTVEYYLRRVVGVVRILDSLDLIGRTAELATLFGIQFFEVLSRGSQFRVESMMLRLAKPMNFVAVSPNMHQRAAMRAPQCLPLIMEPESRFYTDPVIVLDFQSLYPSMMIAYNYCFSTCLGRVDELLSNDEITFGCTSLKVDHKELLALKDSIHISPAGVVFVESDVRKGVLPRMLEEILETRLMVKRSMSNHKNDKKLYKVLHARQLGLKLIANVTYGYTSANFSGRMPCIEVGDSVVSKGRETLERAIKLVNETRRWGARVVYGDTDSLFVLCPSKTKEEAFAIGSEIAREVTQSNPKPVKLKLEKVYQPCFLQTKKRYVGYMYESAEQERPQFDAKGIETVRRDGCIAASKILEKSLKILFESYDVSKVKSYVRSQLAKISKGEMSVQELTFAREYRGMNGYQPSACVPALKLIKEWLLKDRRAEPRIGERVGYVVVYGPPGLPIIRLVRSPHEFISNPSLQINSEYYIARVILPPLQRCFTLIGVDVSSWYKANPKIQKTSRIKLGKNKKETISQYFGTANCLICGRLCSEEVCAKCRLNPPLVSFKLHSEWASLDRNSNLIEQICGSCCGRRYNLDCDSLDCPVYFMKSSRLKGKEKLDQIKEALGNLFPET